MKNLLYILTFIITGSTTIGQEINWMTFDEALAAQKENPKKIIVDAYTDWCGPCKLMDRNTFQNKSVVAFINKHYYAVKFNAEGTEEVNYLGNVYTNPRHDPNRRGRNSQHEFARAMKVRGYPSIVFFDAQGYYIQPVVGYHSPRQLEIYLKMIENDDYLELTTDEKWKEYQDTFEHTFGE